MSPQKTTPIIRLLSAPAIILICILTYWNGIENGFTYDDHYVISANELVRSVDPSQIFTSPFWRGFATEGSGTYYRPFTVLTYSLDHSLYTLAPSGFHLTNILLHTVTALLVLLLSRRLIRSERAALAAGLVFAVHPVLTEAVASASGRSDVLVTLFGLSAILCHLSRRTWVRRASCIPLFLALCSKEIGLVLPTILFICDLLWPRENLSGASHIKSLVKTHALSLAAVIAFVGLRWLAIGSLSTVVPSPMDNPLVEHGFWAGVFTLPAILGHYARLCIFPVSLSIDYGFNQIPVSTEPSVGLAVILVALAAVYHYRHVLSAFPTALLSVTIVVLPIALIANPFMTAGSILSERYLYLPTAGLVLLLASAVHRFRPTYLSDPGRRQLGWAIVLVILAAGISRTTDRVRDWASDETLFKAAVTESPNSVRANLNYAEIMSTKGDHLTASRHFKHVLTLKPDYPIVNLKLARSLQRQGRAEEALHYFSATTRLNPGFVEAWSGLATLSIRMGYDDDAEKALKRAISLTSQNASLYNQLGVVYQRRGQNAEALEAYELALAGDYRHPGVYCNLGIIYQDSGSNDQARTAFDTALRMAPNMALVHYHLGRLELDTGNTNQAIAHFETFLSNWNEDPQVSLQVRETLRTLREMS